MRRSLGMFVVTGVVVGGAVAAFMALLTPQARENLTSTAKRAVEVGRSMAERFSGDPGAAQDAARLEANRVWIERQWEEAGY